MGDLGSDSLDIDPDDVAVGDNGSFTSANAPPQSGNDMRDENDATESRFSSIWCVTKTGMVAERLLYDMSGLVLLWRKIREIGRK